MNRMSHVARCAIAVALLGGVSLPAFGQADTPAATPDPAATPENASGQAVTPERLLNAAAEPQNWLMPNLTYDSHRHSGLTEITKENVNGLRLVFPVAIGGLTGESGAIEHGHQSTPVVNDGIMYVVDGWGTVYGIDVRSGTAGRMLWVMDPGVNRADVWIPSNRGVSLYQNRVISVTGSGQVVWTDATTGELVNSVQVEDPTTGYSLTAPPLVIGDRLIVPGSGGDRGARSHLDAISAENGESLWRRYAVPAPGEPGSETWQGDNNAWQHGGGAFWQVGSYDPDTNLTFWGTGQPVPMFDPEFRPGDNLFTNSSLAIDVDTGDIRWFFQYTPGDFLDYDEVGFQTLIDADVDGQPRQLLGHYGRNGFFYTLDRTNGTFLGAVQYIDELNWTAGIDDKTGKPVDYDPNSAIQTYAVGAPSRREQGEIRGCPQIEGGVNFMPTSYSPRTGLMYGAGIEGCSLVEADPERSQAPVWNGGNATNAGPQRGSIAAVNPVTIERVAKRNFDYTSYSGVLSTAGGVVFTTTVEGTIYALDDETLDVLWTYSLGSLSSAPPMTYAVDGKQYVAVLVGGNSITRGFMNQFPEQADLQNTSMLMVFAL